MGGAQPLAATMQGAAILGVDVDPARIDEARRDGLLRPEDGSRSTRRSRWIRDATATKQRAVGGPRRQRGRGAARARAPRRDARRRDRSDERARPAQRLRARRDCRSTSARRCARAIPRSTSPRATASIVEHVQAMLASCRRGAVTFDYGNNIRAVALDAALASAFDIPGFVPEYIRPLFCEGKGPFRWVALSGDPEDLARTDELVLELFPHDEHLHALDHARARARALPGPAGAHLLARPGRAREVRRRVQRPRRKSARSRRRS